MDEDAAEESLTIVCPACGELWEVKDARAVLLALHMAQQCQETRWLTHD